MRVETTSRGLTRVTKRLLKNLIEQTKPDVKLSCLKTKQDWFVKKYVLYFGPGDSIIIRLIGPKEPKMPDENALPVDYRQYDRIKKILPPGIKGGNKLVLPFLNRSKQLDLFRGVVARISEEAERKTVVPHILNFWGPGGIGKSRLLKDEFPAILKQEPEWRQRWKYVYLNLEEDRPGDADRIKINDLQSCLSQLSIQLSRKLDFPLNNPLANIEVKATSDKQIKFAESLVAEVKTKLNEQPSRRLLIMLDGLTQTKDWFALLEKHFLSPLIKNVLVVIGSRAAVRLDRFELRLQLKPSLVKAFVYKQAEAEEEPPLDITDLLRGYFAILKRDFAKEEVKDQLQKTGCRLLELSKGHPAALRFLLQAVGNDLDEAQHRLDEHSLTLKTSLSEYILTTYVQAGGLATKEEDLQAAVREMAVYRRFDITMLQAACQNTPDPAVQAQFAGKNAAYFTQLSQDMVRTYLVDWKIEQRGFVIEQCYREILAQGLEAAALEADQPDQFRARHKQAVQLYQELTTWTQDQHRQEDDTLQLYQAELAYHKERAAFNN